MREVHRTGRWFGLAGAALVAVGVGLVGQVPALVLLGGLGVTLSAYDRVAVPPAADISIQRSITPTEPALGERVTSRSPSTTTGHGRFRTSGSLTACPTPCV